MIDAISDAITRNKRTLEELLGGERVYDESCLPEKKMKYAQGAVSVKPDHISDRGNNFTLVLGPSGSGKTYFALYGLPKLAFRETASNEILVVHFKAYTVNTIMKTEHHPSFPQAVASYVEQQINQRLSGKMSASGTYVDDSKMVELALLVVIDEAGGDVYKEYFESAENVEAIVTALKEKMDLKFMKRIHVTVAGTRLEATTDAISSVVQTTKFRMQPWTLRNFDAMVDASTHSDKELVKEVVHSFSILESLTSNARCAFYLLNVMTDYSFLRRNRVKQFVGLAISSVAESYERSNGLDTLTRPEDKWDVVRSVFQAVDKAAKNPTLPFIPKFEDLKTNSLRSIASSLVSVNVETTSKGEAKWMDQHVISVSLSAAVSIVLANLLNTEATLAWDWQAFESTVTLCEWKWMITNATTTPSTDVNRTIIELRAPLPTIISRGDLKDDIEIKLPLVNRYKVVVNGPRSASYADVIAPRRLVQAKHSTKGDENTKYLDLLNELGKMGLTTEPKWRMQQAITSVFDTMWDDEAEEVALETEDRVLDRPKEQINAYYPYNSMLARWVVGQQHAEINCQILKGSDAVTIMEEKEVQVKILKKFNRPIVAVFTTNCKNFVLTGSKIQIGPSDVCRLGGQALEEEEEASKTYRCFFACEGLGSLHFLLNQ
jgi:hypothetical protein